jgi:hypothetical protein
MQSLSMQFQLSCLMLVHSARHAIQLLNMADAGDTDTVQKQIRIMQRVTESATYMSSLITTTPSNETLAELVYRLVLISQLMGYNTNFDESMVPPNISRWEDFQLCMDRLELRVIPENIQDLIAGIWNAWIILETEKAISKVKTTPGVYYMKTSQIDALCFNICVICFCMQKHIENETKSAM